MYTTGEETIKFNQNMSLVPQPFVQNVTEGCGKLIKIRIPDGSKPGMKIIATIPDSNFVYIHQLNKDDFNNSNDGYVFINMKSPFLF
tara:strand:- start:1054 stop:1314 length:261 start_codon:yes stop_codon:yes gene_type:complete